ncbi:MAG: cohesin domain-containing protein [Peptococcaceae bacterium]|nr:cohesin domain-containing protein [Peptococcaceae bacterium]
MKKAIFAVLLLVSLLLLSLVSMPAFALAAEGYGPNGKFLAPISAPIAGSQAISNRAQLEAISNNLGGNYHLTTDIDLSGAEWAPIGIEDATFTGTFDGQGHVIRNMKITGEGYLLSNGLFYYTLRATIKNVGMEDAYLDIANSGFSCVGSISGYDEFSTITNCYNTGRIIVSGEAAIGYAGGLTARSSNSTITYCYNTGDISASGPTSEYFYGYVGGICGIMESVTISNCYNSGDISTSGYGLTIAGGITGWGWSENSSISDCLNTGKISTNNSNHTISGGIVGTHDNLMITNCLNTGVLVSNSNTDKADIGGIVGENTGTVTTTNNYCPNLYGSPYGTQLTSEQMTNPASYTGWDFVNVWDISPSVNNGLPFLRGMNVGPTVHLGDINGDGRVNLSDLSFLAQYFIGGYGIEDRFPTIYMTGDMNRDGELKLDDMDLLVYVIVNSRVTAMDNGQQTASQAMTIAAFDVAMPVDDGVTVITVPALDGKVGERISVPVFIENSPGVKMYQLAMQYDNSKLEFISQSSGSSFAQPASLRNGGPIQVDGDIWEARVTYLGELLAPQIVYGDVVICEFEFEIREGAAAGATPLTLKPSNSYILSASGKNVYPAINVGEITIEAPGEIISYNFRTYMEAAQTNIKAGDTLSVDVMLTGDLNYTQFNTAIAYDAGLLEFAGYANLGGLVAEVKKDGADKISVRSVASMNMMAGAPCVTPVRVVTLKFTVKDTFTAESIATDLSFVSIAVTSAAGVTGTTTAPGKALSVMLVR